MKKEHKLKIRSASILFFLFLFFIIPNISSQNKKPFNINESPLPKPQGFVADYAEVLDSETKAKIESRLVDFRNSTRPSVEIGVAIVKTTGDIPIFDYSLAVARGWGVGSKEEDNPGALLFVAIEDRKYFTQVSRDLEDELPDGLVGSLQRKFLVPEFRKGNYSKGVEDTISAYIRTIDKRQIASKKFYDELSETNVDLLPTEDNLVIDDYGILNTPVITVMNRRLVNFRKESDPPVSVGVVIVESIGDVPISKYALAIAKKSGIGNPDENDRSVLLLISMDDRKYFTQVSHGLKNKLTKETIERIERNHLQVTFNSFYSGGSYNQAISDTVDFYVRIIDPKQPRVDHAKGNPDGYKGYDSFFHYLNDSKASICVVIIILGIVIFFIVGAILNFFDDDDSSSGSSSSSSWSGGGSSWSSGSSSSSSWTSGSSSSGFGGFGGGGDFGGGGSGGSW